MNKAKAIEDRIRGMTKAEKVEELRAYLNGGLLLGVDIDRIMADQVILGLPDSTIDDALLRLAVLMGSIRGDTPMTAPEFIETLKLRKDSLDNGGPIDQLGDINGSPRFSLRRRKVVRPLG